MTFNESMLRYLIDAVGIDRVVLGTDWPYPVGIEHPVEWLNAMKSLSRKEKEAILWKNLEKLLALGTPK